MLEVKEGLWIKGLVDKLGLNRNTILILEKK